MDAHKKIERPDPAHNFLLKKLRPMVEPIGSKNFGSEQTNFFGLGPAEPKLLIKIE